MTKDIFMINGIHKINPLMIATALANDSLKNIIESDICTQECINIINVDKITPLAHSIVSNNLNSVKLLLESEYNISPSFIQKYKQK